MKEAKQGALITVKYKKIGFIKAIKLIFNRGNIVDKIIVGSKNMSYILTKEPAYLINNDAPIWGCVPFEIQNIYIKQDSKKLNRMIREYNKKVNN
jgi:hypothetical protein